MSRALPTVQQVSALIHSLTGRNVQLKSVGPIARAKVTPGLVAVYRSDDGALGVTIACDVAFAAGVGAALTMIPADVVKECAQDGELTERLTENAHEVLNIAAGLFNDRGDAHVALTEIVPPKADVPAAVTAVLDKPGARLDLEGAVEGYPPGRLTLFVP